MGLDYKKAGVDVEAGYKAVELMSKHVKRTFRPEVITDLGGFGGLFSLSKDKYDEPVLVSGTDGVGTKLKLAFLMDKHDTIGIDCVAMCVNDILCSGAEPLFFLDYIACGKNTPEKIADVVSGVSEGCVQAGAALIGGETAEMPGFYSENEYDIAGFSVGIVDKKNIIDGSQLSEGDVLIGLASSGIHSNGYSLVRKVFDIDNDINVLHKRYVGLNKTLGEELLTPTKIYVKAVNEVKSKVKINAICHITGGGFIENVPRMLQEGCQAVIQKDSWKVPSIFKCIQTEGNVSEDNMYNTFNMGIGMILAVRNEDAEEVLNILNDTGECGYKIGHIEKGHKGVILC